MRVRVVKVGKPVDRAYEQLVARFEKRLKGFCKVESHILKAHEGLEKSKKELWNKLGLDPSSLKADPSHLVIAMDERGTNFSSPQVAKLLQDSMNDGRVKSLAFVIGGPYGIPDELREKAHHIWSLSNAVFPSDMAWVMVWEQIYRASAIIRGTAYHHE